MKDAPYAIVFKGELIDGVSRDQAIEKLTQAMKKDRGVIEQLFSGSPKVLKSGVNRATAANYTKAFATFGIKTHLVQMDAAKADAKPESPDTAKASTSQAPSQSATSSAPTTESTPEPEVIEAEPISAGAEDESVGTVAETEPVGTGAEDESIGTTEGGKDSESVAPAVEASTSDEPSIESAPEVEIIEESAPEVEIIEESAPEPEIIEESAPEVEIIEESVPEPEIIEESAPEPEIIEESAPEPEIIEESAPEAEIIEESAPEPEIIEESAPEAEVIEEPTSEPEVIEGEPDGTTAEAEPVSTTAEAEPVSTTDGVEVENSKIIAPDIPADEQLNIPSMDLNEEEDQREAKDYDKIIDQSEAPKWILPAGFDEKDLDALSMAEVGEEITKLKSDEHHPIPDTTGISLVEDDD